MCRDGAYQIKVVKTTLIRTISHAFLPTQVYRRCDLSTIHLFLLTLAFDFMLQANFVTYVQTYSRSSIMLGPIP